MNDPDPCAYVLTTALRDIWDSAPISRTVELSVAPRIAAVRVSSAAEDYASARCNRTYPLGRPLAFGTADDSPALVEHPKETFAAALSAQLPTALMLHVT